MARARRVSVPVAYSATLLPTLPTGPTLRAVKTSRLFATRPYYGFIDTFAPTYDYDPATDRFLMARWALRDAGTEDLHVVRDGFGLLNRLAPRR